MKYLKDKWMDYSIDNWEELTPAEKIEDLRKGVKTLGWALAGTWLFIIYFLIGS